MNRVGLSDKTNNIESTKTSIVLFGSLGVAVDCLEWLLKQPMLEVCGVVCSRADRKKWRESVGDRDMQEHASVLGVPLLTLDDVLQMKPDIGLSVRFHQILSPAHLERFRMGVINLHGGILPEMRGSMCDAAAILEKRAEFGTTLHWMNNGIDTGDILAEKRFAISSNDTVYDLFTRCNESGLQLIQTHLSAIIGGTIQGIPQDQIAEERHLKPATYRSKYVMKYKQVSHGLNPEELRVVIRAFQFPGHEPAFLQTPLGKIHFSVTTISAT
jgi:methionyl-tRNA formyltransferase